MLREVASLYPNLKLIASTLRSVRSATQNAWGAIALYEDKIVHVPQTDIRIMDRVGGGDSFASGLIYGLLANKGIDYAARCGIVDSLVRREDHRSGQRQSCRLRQRGP